MPYNGIKATAARKRLADVLARKEVQFNAPVKGQQTSPWGYRMHPILHERKFHEGVDYGAPEGTPVYATEDGVITGANAQIDPIQGRRVVVTHPQGLQSKYLHLSKLSPQALKGGMVKQGDLLGYVGTTGRSTGPHLHYGMTLDGSSIDPSSFLSPQKRYAGV